MALVQYSQLPLHTRLLTIDIDKSPKRYGLVDIGNGSYSLPNTGKIVYDSDRELWDTELLFSIERDWNKESVDMSSFSSKSLISRIAEGIIPDELRDLASTLGVSFGVREPDGNYRFYFKAQDKAKQFVAGALELGYLSKIENSANLGLSVLVTDK